MFLADAKGLRIDNDLMFAVDRRDSGITLDCAIARGHLRRFIVGDVTFHFLRFLALAI